MTYSSQQNTYWYARVVQTDCGRLKTPRRGFGPSPPPRRLAAVAVVETRGRPRGRRASPALGDAMRATWRATHVVVRALARDPLSRDLASFSTRRPVGWARRVRRRPRRLASRTVPARARGVRPARPLLSRPLLSLPRARRLPLLTASPTPRLALPSSDPPVLAASSPVGRERSSRRRRGRGVRLVAPRPRPVRGLRRPARVPPRWRHGRDTRRPPPPPPRPRPRARPRGARRAPRRDPRGRVRAHPPPRGRLAPARQARRRGHERPRLRAHERPPRPRRVQRRRADPARGLRPPGRRDAEGGESAGRRRR